MRVVPLLGGQIEVMGHTVVFIPPQYVKPYLRTNKNGFNDARAICEAALRLSTPTVPVKSEDAQDIQSLHRARQHLVRSQTATINHFRGILLEYEISLGKSPKKVREEVPEEALSPFLRETGRPGPTSSWPPPPWTRASGQKNPIREPAPSS